MRRLLILLIALGCGEPDDVLVVDPDDLGEGPLPATCDPVEGGTFEAIDLDVEALDADLALDLGDADFTLELDPSGTFTSLLVTDGEAFLTEGTWTVVDDELLIDPFLPGIGDVTALECRVEEGELSLYGFTSFDFDGDGVDDFVDAQFLGDLVQLR